MAKALSHPVRVQILACLREREASPSDISREIDVPVVNVSHHIQVLLKLGVIQQVAVRHVRGALEHRYRVVPQMTLSPEHFKTLPPAAIRTFIADAAQGIVDGLVEAIASDYFYERANNHVSWTPLELDEEGWENVHDLLTETIERALAEQEAARARAAARGTDSELIRGRLNIMHFEMPPFADEADQSADDAES